MLTGLGFFLMVVGLQDADEVRHTRTVALICGMRSGGLVRVLTPLPNSLKNQEQSHHASRTGITKLFTL
jgi:hypothetical protein